MTINCSQLYEIIIMTCSYFPRVPIVCVEVGAGLVQSLGPVALLPFGRPRPDFFSEAGAGSLMVLFINELLAFGR